MLISNVSNEIGISSQELKKLSLSLIGKDLTRYVNARKMLFYIPETDDAQDEYDFALLDFIEVIIVFAKSDKREELLSRFSKHFQDEGGDFSFYRHMIVQGQFSSLRSMIPLVDDRALKSALEELFMRSSPSRLSSRAVTSDQAQISANLLENVLSDPASQSMKKAHAEHTLDKIAETWVKGKNKDTLKELLNEYVKSLKALNNNIQSVRHHERSKILVEHESIYMFITKSNLALVELIMQTLLADYAVSDTAESTKVEYIASYAIKNSEVMIEPELDLSDIPF